MSHSDLRAAIEANKVMEKRSVSFDYGPPLKTAMEEAMKTLVQQDDFRGGIGGHGEQNHGPHGLHRQTSIGVGNTTVNFRELLESEK